METPVSAFAIYKSNKSANKIKKQKKRNKSSNQSIAKLPSKISKDEIDKDIAQKIKRKQKKQKETKNLVKMNKLLKKNGKRVSFYNKKQLMEKKNTDDKHVLVCDPTSTKSAEDSTNGFEEYFPNSKSTNSLWKSSESTTNGCEECPCGSKSLLPSGDNISVTSSGSETGFEFTPIQTDSAKEGLKVFKWMIAPYNPEDFLTRVWEKKPLHIARKKPKYYTEIINTPVIDQMLRVENIQFTKNIDVTSYVDGKRETHNPEGRAHPHLVWDYYLNGCSIRLLNPQTYIPKLHLLNATMQEYFNSFVGANAYLTPPDSQGFAPHYDDIEAFILQAEGKKLWRIYKPLHECEVLPRVSSKNYDEQEIGEPILEVTLEAGDMLYFPRGYIHQGVTVNCEHSLHVTISMYQKHSWADLFEKMLPCALQLAINENVELRKGLPLDIYDHFGLVHSDSNTRARQQIKDVICSLFDQIKNHLPIDEGVDQMHKNYQQAALPPVLNDIEKAVTVFGDTDVMIENGQVINRVEISLDTKIRLLRKNILRMVSEDKIRLYYYVENSLEYHGNELPYLEIEEDIAPAIETLITTYPEYISVENLDLCNDTDKLQIADALWSRGLIMTEYPLENIDD